MHTRSRWTIELAGVMDIVEEHGKLIVGEKGEVIWRVEKVKVIPYLSINCSHNIRDRHQSALTELHLPITGRSYSHASTFRRCNPSHSRMSP
jgi:hypothetical protein